MNDNYKDILDLLEKSVLAATKHLLLASSEREKIQVKSKPDHTIVMNLDIECQQKIKQVLNTAYPVIGEEDEASHNLIGNQLDYFIVDPIDGTASCRRYLGIEGGQIGFGPLAGFVEKGKLKFTVYYSMPAKCLYTAVAGAGTYVCHFDPVKESQMPVLNKRKKLFIKSCEELNKSAIIFYPGSLDELKIVMYLRTNGLVENTYRLGGFANDSIRLAEGYEQIQLQSRVKAWDYPAVLFAKEAGLSVIIDPFNKQIKFEDWTIQHDNPVLIAHNNVIEKLLTSIHCSLTGNQI